MEEELKKLPARRPSHAVILLKEYVSFFSNWIAFCTIVLFVIDFFFFADWTLNPIDWLLYVRSWGFILPANHVSSEAAILGTATYFCIKNRASASKWVFLIFSTGSIHEFILDAWNVPAMLAAHTLSYTLSFRWMFWLSFFLVPAIVMANRNQRIVLLRITAFCVVYIGAWVWLAVALNINTYTIMAFQAGPAYRDFLPNFFEVTSWIVPPLLWFTEGKQYIL